MDVLPADQVRPPQVVVAEREELVERRERPGVRVVVPAGVVVVQPDDRVPAARPSSGTRRRPWTSRRPRPAAPAGRAASPLRRRTATPRPRPRRSRPPNVCSVNGARTMPCWVDGVRVVQHQVVGVDGSAPSSACTWSTPRRSSGCCPTSPARSGSGSPGGPRTGRRPTSPRSGTAATPSNVRRVFAQSGRPRPAAATRAAAPAGRPGRTPACPPSSPTFTSTNRFRKSARSTSVASGGRSCQYAVAAKNSTKSRKPVLVPQVAVRPAPGYRV